VAEPASTHARAGFDSGMAVLIVGGALVPVAQDLVGLLRLLEMLLGFRVVGVAVGVVLHRQPPIGLLQVIVAGVPVHAEDVVVISLCHCLVQQSVEPRAVFAGAGRKCL